MTSYVVFIAMLLSIAVIQRRGIEAAFLWVWIPFFLALPFAFWVNIPGLPDPNFMQAAILPLLFVLVRVRIHLIRLGPMETLMLLYIAIRLVADFMSRGYSDAQNYGFYMLTCVAGPYLLGRHLITDRRMDVATAKAFVLMFLIFFPMFLFEAKFWVSPVFKLLSPLFPDASSGLSLRWGIARTAGTFEHPILACIMVIVVYRLHRWLCWSGEWKQPEPGILGRLQKWATHVPFSFENQISLVLIVMAIMTISRGPWIGALAAAALVSAGNARNRKRALGWLALALVIGAILGKMALDAYITPEQGAVLSGEAETMLYRKVMIERYQAFLMERLWWGWGLTDVPKIPGMESVDNAFFLMALQHGVLAPAVFVLMFVFAIVSQLKLGLQAPAGQAPIGFTFSGIYLMCFVAFATVYMGAQTEPMLFLLLGWGESVKHRSAAAGLQENGASTPVKAPAFRRVLR